MILRSLVWLRLEGGVDNWVSPVAQMVNNLPAIRDTWVWSLDQEDPLEKGIATHSSILFFFFNFLFVVNFVIKKNSFESVLMRWMKLEPIIQSEVSQKDKDHYNILTHIYGIIPVFLLEEFFRQGSLAGYSPWDCKESDTTEWLTWLWNLYATNEIKYNWKYIVV